MGSGLQSGIIGSCPKIHNTIRKDILFLRGNLNYTPVATNTDFPRFSDPSNALIRTDQNAELIFENTAILIPVLTAQYSVGDIYDGRRLNDEHELRDAVNRDSDESLCVWATITHKKRTSRIVDDLKVYRVESPLFQTVNPSQQQIEVRNTGCCETRDVLHCSRGILSHDPFSS